MSRKEIIDSVSEKLELPKTDVKRVYIAIFEELKAKLLKDNSVQLPDFGILKLKKSKATTARNPRTQEAVKVPARNRVSFKVTKSLKDKVRSMKVVKG